MQSQGRIQLIARVLIAASLGIMAGIHLRLYSAYDYKAIHVIGALFLVNGIAGSVLCVAILGAPRRFLGLTSLASAGLLAGTAAGLVFALNHPLFGFRDSIHAPYAWPVLIDEVVGAVIAGALAVAEVRRVSVRSFAAVWRRA